MNYSALCENKNQHKFYGNNNNYNVMYLNE